MNLFIQKLVFKFLYISIYCCSFFLFHFPLLRKFFAFLLGLFWFDVLRLRRNVVLDNLTIAFPQKSQAEKVKIGRQSMVLLCAHFLETMMIVHLNEAWVRKNVIFEGLENYHRALERKKGVLILTLHLGCGDLCASIMNLHGHQVSIITKFFKNKVANDLWFAVRGATGVGFIPPHGEKAPFDILRRLRKNEGVAFVIDQFMGRPYGLETTFFGKLTGTAMGLAVFKLKTDAPILPIYSYYTEDGFYKIVLEPELNVEGLISGEKDLDLTRMTQAFNDKAEEVIRMYPNEWMWIHRRWKEYE